LATWPTWIRRRARHAYIAPQVVLELGTQAEFIPSSEFFIRSFAAEQSTHYRRLNPTPALLPMLQ